jgi:hypothetical protein
VIPASLPAHLLFPRHWIPPPPLFKTITRPSTIAVNPFNPFDPLHPRHRRRRRPCRRTRLPGQGRVTGINYDRTQDISIAHFSPLICRWRLATSISSPIAQSTQPYLRDPTHNPNHRTGTQSQLQAKNLRNNIPISNLYQQSLRNPQPDRQKDSSISHHHFPENSARISRLPPIIPLQHISLIPHRPHASNVDERVSREEKKLTAWSKSPNLAAENYCSPVAPPQL